MKTYEEFILWLTNKARQQQLGEIEAGILRDNGQVAELQTEFDDRAKLLRRAYEYVPKGSSLQREIERAFENRMT